MILGEGEDRNRASNTVVSLNVKISQVLWGTFLGQLFCMKFFDKIRNQSSVLLVMHGAHNKMALFIFWSILASAFLTYKNIFAVRLMVRPPNVTFTVKRATHCKASAAGLLL